MTAHLENLTQRWRILGFSCFFVRRMAKLKMLEVAASLTFTTLLAIVPLLTIILTILSLPSFSNFSSHFKAIFIKALVPEYSAKISAYLNQFIEHVGNLTPFSLIMLSVTSILLMRTIEGALNDIWRVSEARSITKQILIYWVALTLGPLLLGVGISFWRLFYANFGVYSEWTMLTTIIGMIGSLAFTTMLLWLLYYLVPNIKVPATHALCGAIIAAIIIEIGRLCFSYYVRNMASYQVLYGAFAGLPVFLLWLYCLWLAVLIGATLSASFSYWSKKTWQRPNDAGRYFQDSIEILLLLCQAQKNGKSVKILQMQQQINTGFDQLARLLDTLNLADYIQHGEDGWVLKRSAEHISLCEVLRLYIKDCPPEHGNEIEKQLSLLIQPMFLSLNITLAEFLTRISTNSAKNLNEQCVNQVILPATET